MPARGGDLIGGKGENQVFIPREEINFGLFLSIHTCNIHLVGYSVSVSTSHPGLLK